MPGTISTIANGSTATSVSTVAGHGSYALGMVDAAAHGDIKGMAIQTVMKVGMSTQTYEAAAKLTAEVAPVSEALSGIGGFLARNAPIIGGVLLAINDSKEVYDHLKKGDYKGAAVAFAAGAAEVTLTTVGGPLGSLAGAAAREAIVEGVAHLGGPRVNDAGLVIAAKAAIKIGEKGYAATSRFMAEHSHDPAKIAAEQIADLHNDGVLPKTVKFGGKEIGLDVALRNPVFNKDFRANLLASQKNGHLDAKPLIASIDKFDAQEKLRVAAVKDTTTPAAQTASARPVSHAAAAHA